MRTIAPAPSTNGISPSSGTCSAFVIGPGVNPTAMFVVAHEAPSGSRALSVVSPMRSALMPIARRSEARDGGATRTTELLHCLPIVLAGSHHSARLPRAQGLLYVPGPTRRSLRRGCRKAELGLKPSESLPLPSSVLIIAGGAVS